MRRLVVSQTIRPSYFPAVLTVDALFEMLVAETLGVSISDQDTCVNAMKTPFLC
jgi:hypothetical protein